MAIRPAAILAILMFLVLSMSSGSARAAEKSPADDARVGRAINMLFEAGWKSSSKARTETDLIYEKVEQFLPGELRAMYAYAIVKIKQRDYDIASKTLGDILKIREDDLPARKARIWIAMLTKKYPQSLSEMERLSRQLPKGDQPATPQQRDVARHLGRLFGFLEGPAGSAVDGELLGRYERGIGDRLTTDLEPIFEQARDEVARQFTELTEEKDEITSRDKAAAEEERARQLENLEKQRVAIDKRREDLAPERDKIRKEARSELEKIAAEDKPLARELAQIDSQITIIRTELLTFTRDLDIYQSRYARERDPIIRGGLLREIDRMNIIGTRYQVDLNRLKRRAAGVIAKRAEIQRRLARKQAEVAGQINELDKELGQLSRDQKRTENELKRGQRDNTGYSSKGRALAKQAAAFTTYFPFPLEAEKERLLEMFR